jgi:DNA polymerase-3 subunit gamma/tau
VAHQSLYRRYRPRRFDEVRGQDHVISALRNAVRNESEGHAYLFSGPRGTGKTSTARILAKALNCENLQQGEPCCECTPCVDMEAGRSFDLFELDAASNNGVDAVRDLIERTAVGSPGRTKVYILDEVHMLSPGASNALLKTLEEPPDHVRFVLATTDPQKVLPTIRSRTQHFEFQLLTAQELESQVRWIVADADLDVDDEAIAWVVQKGRGSSRDTLSALDQVVAAGGVITRAEPVERLYESLVAKDTGMAVVAVADALAQGHDPRVLGAAFLDSLRDAFLVSLGVEVPHLMEHDRELYGRWAAELGTPALTRAMEAVGSALVDMRQAADPRVPLEVALVRLTSASSATSPGGTSDGALDALIARIERLEASATAAPVAASPAAAAAPAAPTSSAATRSPEPAVPAPADADVPARAEPARSAASSAGGGRDAGDSGGGPAQARAELARLKASRENGTDASAAATDRPARAPRNAPPPVPGAPPPVPGAATASPDPAPSAASAESPPPVSGAPASASGATAPSPDPAASPDAPPVADSTSPAPADAAPAPDAVPASDSATNQPGPATPAATTGSVPAAPPSSSAPVTAPDDAAAAPAEPTAPAPAASPGGDGALGLEQLTAALAAAEPELRAPAKAACKDGTFVSVDGASAVFELATGVPTRHAERFRGDIESALSDRLGRPVTLTMVPHGDGIPAASATPRISGGAVDLTEPAADEADEALTIDIHELEDATDVAETGIDRLTRAFPGAVVIEEDEVTG